MTERGKRGKTKSRPQHEKQLRKGARLKCQRGARGKRPVENAEGSAVEHHSSLRSVLAQGVGSGGTIASSASEKRAVLPRVWT